VKNISFDSLEVYLILVKMVCLEESLFPVITTLNSGRWIDNASDWIYTLSDWIQKLCHETENDKRILFNKETFSETDRLPDEKENYTVQKTPLNTVILVENKECYDVLLVELLGMKWTALSTLIYFGSQKYCGILQVQIQSHSGTQKCSMQDRLLLFP